MVGERENVFNGMEMIFYFPSFLKKSHKEVKKLFLQQQHQQMRKLFVHQIQT